LTPKQFSLSSRFVAYLGRRSVQSLLLFVLAATLIPVFVISFGQAFARLSLDREVVRQNLIDNVTLSAEQALHVIDSAELSLKSLSARDEVRNTTPDCAKTLAIAQVAMPYTTNLARIDANGMVTCSAHAIKVNPDMSKKSWLSDLSKSTEISFAGPALELPSSIPVLIIGLGLKDENGIGVGHIVAGINIEKLERGLQKRKSNSTARLTLVDHLGTQMHHASANKPIDAVQEFQIDTKSNSQNKVIEARDKNGELWTYARATLVPERLYVAYTMPDDILYSSTFSHVGTDIALPLIALIFASAGLWYAIQLWAIKPIESLRALAKQYAVGRFDAVPPDLRHGPIEMKELRDDLVGMAARAGSRDERMKRVARQKDDLLKELHHRVKNNLQIVISLIGLQTRQIDDPAQKAPLERVHARIMAMSLVERLIVETDDNPTLDVCILLEEICGLVRRLYQADSLRIKLNFECDHVQIATEKATALALFAFEAITNAFRHGFPNKSEGSIFLRFEIDAKGLATLTVHDTGSGWDELNKETGTGQRLLKAFARQLGGQFSLVSSPTEGSHVNLSFIIHGPPPVPSKEAMAGNTEQTKLTGVLSS
jgi:two-component sensor histidine kinase